jgi:hypothetical protein
MGMAAHARASERENETAYLLLPQASGGIDGAGRRDRVLCAHTRTQRRDELDAGCRNTRRHEHNNPTQRETELAAKIGRRPGSKRGLNFRKIQL